MSAYRNDARWGKSLGEHRANRASWLLAVFIGLAGSIGLIYFITSDRDASAKTLVGAVLMPCVTLWAAREWLRLGRVSLRLYENGMKFHDGNAEHAIAWDEVTSLLGQYVPGVRGKGIQDEGNLVALIVTFKAGRVSLPKELAGFSIIVEEVKARTQAPYQKALIANLMSRES